MNLKDRSLQPNEHLDVQILHTHTDRVLLNPNFVSPNETNLSPKLNKLSPVSDPYSTPCISPNLIGDQMETRRLLNDSRMVSEHSCSTWLSDNRDLQIGTSDHRNELDASSRRSKLNVFGKSKANLVKNWFSRCNCFATGVFLSSGIAVIYF